MKKSYYDKTKNCYIDTTTYREYYPKTQCEICGASYPLSVHHFLNQTRCLKSLEAKKVKFPKMWTEDFINDNQKLFTLCFQCHNDVENLSNEKFKQKYNLNRSDFIYLDN